MIEGMPWIAQLGFASGGWALVVLFVWMIFTGRVATRREVLALERALDKMTVERDRWQSAENVRSRQLSHIMDATGTSTAFIAAVVKPDQETP
jgi:hypothetical protein